MITSSEKILKLIYDLNDLGHKVMYVVDKETGVEYILIPESYTAYNPANNVYHCSIKGKDITNRIDNFSANMQNSNTILTIIENIEVRSYEWSYNIKYTLYG